MFTVVMTSDEYGPEEFPRKTIREALMTVRDLMANVDQHNDGVERVFSLLLDEETLAVLFSQIKEEK